MKIALPLFIITILVLGNMLAQAGQEAAGLPEEDIEVIQNLEILEDLEMLESMNLLEDYETINGMQELEPKEESDEK